MSAQNDLEVLLGRVAHENDCTECWEGGRGCIGHGLVFHDAATKFLARWPAADSVVRVPIEQPTPERFDFEQHLQRQAEWSAQTFGPGDRLLGVIDHITKELKEIQDASEGERLAEWIDVVILALDGAWRSGAAPSQIVAALVGKQSRNEARVWPDWRTTEPGKAIEHVRAEELQPTAQPGALARLETHRVVDEYADLGPETEF